MFTDGESAEQEVPRRYLVTCDGCAFEQSADGREEATAVGTDHRQETHHDVIAVEMPRSVDSS